MHANLAGIASDRCSRARLRMRCVVVLCRLCLVPVLGEHHISLINKSTVIVPPSIVLLVHVRVFCLYSYALMSVRSNSYASIAYPSQGENLRGKKNNLAGVPDNRCNSSARIRMECVIVPSWPLPGTRFQVNITTLANSDFPLPSGGNRC